MPGGGRGMGSFGVGFSRVGAFAIPSRPCECLKSPTPLQRLLEKGLWGIGLECEHPNRAYCPLGLGPSGPASVASSSKRGLRL